MANEESVRTRYTMRATEIQWRGIQRDAAMVFAFLVCGTLINAGVWALAAPILLMFLGSIWVHHDRRIGSNARYLREVILIR